MQIHSKKYILVFGGCFNPPLNSHLGLAKQIVNTYKEIEKIIFVPVNSNYQKEDLISNEHRYQMLKLICDQNEKLEVSRIELDSPRPLYTIETLKKFKELYPNYEIAFLLGSDNLKELDTWKEAEELTKDFKFYVIKRNQDKIEEIIQKNKLLRKNQENFIKIDEQITSILSSTYARERLKQGKTIEDLTSIEVATYIQKNKLYQIKGE